MMKFAVSVLTAVLAAGVYYTTACREIEESVIRMHVIANSNDERDTEIKLAVRDGILDKMREKITKKASRNEIIASIPEIEAGANELLEDMGVDYGARVSFEETDIERKSYDGIVLPRGSYEAIRVVLGHGGGGNWWCVAYPPLCFTEEVCGELSEEGKEILRDVMGTQSYRIITSDIRYELKIVEAAEKIVRALKKNH